METEVKDDDGNVLFLEDEDGHMHPSDNEKWNGAIVRVGGIPIAIGTLKFKSLGYLPPT